MKVESVEWSMGRSPDSIIEIWSVAATMESIILVLATDNQEAMAAFLAGSRQVVATPKKDEPPARRRPKKGRRAASK